MLAHISACRCGNDGVVEPVARLARAGSEDMGFAPKPDIANRQYAAYSLRGMPRTGGWVGASHAFAGPGLKAGSKRRAGRVKRRRGG